jgi:hypothetical protein
VALSMFVIFIRAAVMPAMVFHEFDRRADAGLAHLRHGMGRPKGENARDSDRRNRGHADYNETHEYYSSVDGKKFPEKPQRSAFVPPCLPATSSPVFSEGSQA